MLFFVRHEIHWGLQNFKTPEDIWEFHSQDDIIVKYSGNQIAVLDTDNLIELFNKDYEHVESVRTSVWFLRLIL